MPAPLPETESTRTLRAWQRLWARLVRFASRLELLLHRLRWGLRRRYGRLGPLQLVTYRTFGNAQQLSVRGRVVEASTLARSLPADSRFQSVRRTLRRFHTREVPDVSVRVTFGAQRVSGTTDHEGYFEVTIPQPELGGPGAWKTAEVELTSAPVRGFSAVRATAQILVPPPSAELGIISDIDDTVLRTYVTRTLKMIWVTLSGSAYTRQPFEGTSELYRALVAGASGHANNPVFYVSKSPWNLYDLLVDFMDYHELPRGALLLRDIGVREAPPLDHKSEAVERLLESYPRLRFVLIGDSGERDAEIYCGLAERHPGRVAAIYIRDLGPLSFHDSAQQRRDLRLRAAAQGTEMLWITHAEAALEHARESRLVRRP